MINIGVRSHRLCINLAKVTTFFAAFVGFTCLLGRPLYGASLLHLTLLVILGGTTCAALIDVLLESFCIPRRVIFSLSAAAAGLIVVNAMSVYYHTVWGQGDFLRSATILLVFALLFSMHIVLAYSDMEMDIDKSNNYHPAGRRREAKFFRHMAFNVLPYIVGFGGTYLISKAYGESSALLFSVGMTATLLLFAILDEALRCRLRWSFFWRNDPEHRRS